VVLKINPAGNAGVIEYPVMMPVAEVLAKGVMGVPMGHWIVLSAYVMVGGGVVVASVNVAVSFAPPTAVAITVYSVGVVR
jgi:hypothetical protein